LSFPGAEGNTTISRNMIQLISTTARFQSFIAGYPPNSSPIVRNSISAFYGTRDGVTSRGAGIDFVDVSYNSSFPTEIRSGEIQFYTAGVVAQGVDASQRMVINGSGNVGIGRTEPSSALDVSGSAYVRLNSSSPLGGFMKPYLIPGIVGGLSLGALSGSTGAELPVIYCNDSAMVGIGTTTPGATLHVNGAGASASYSSYQMVVQNSSSAPSRKLMIGVDGVSASLQSAVNDNASAFLTLNPLGGNVGIGTTNPAQGALQVNGRSMFGWSSGVRRGMLIDNESAYGVTPCIQGVDSALGTNAISINPAGGNVGIGTNNPVYPFDVNGNARFKGTVGYSPAGASANTMYYWWTTTQFGFSVDNASFYYVSPSSDYRIKENIQSPSPILSRLCAINMIEYEFKTEGVMKNDGKRLGVFAHELQEAFPEYPNIVMGKKDEVNEDGSIKIQSVAGEAIGYLVMKSVQELASQATSHATLVQELSTQLAATQQQLAAKSASLDALIAWAQTMGYSASV
jgi:hypothetical protein